MIVSSSLDFSVSESFRPNSTNVYNEGERYTSLFEGFHFIEDVFAQNGCVFPYDDENARNAVNDYERRWFQLEKNMWQLVFSLYNERLRVTKMEEIGMDQDDSDEEIQIASIKQLHEKDIIEKFYKNNQLVREVQIVIDWLERTAANSSGSSKKTSKVYQFTDLAVCWENTLHQITMPMETEFKDPLKRIVTYLHPDSVHVEDTALNVLDQDDEERLSRDVFYEIRCGRLDNAKRLCTYCGHDWKAAIFEGWRLFNDPNFKCDRQPKPVIGNFKRDVWKINAWRCCHSEKVGKYDKASIAAYCGGLEPLLDVCKTWEDTLWAYLRTIIDIRVESEIRDNLLKKFENMPTEYWSNKMSLEEIFEKLSNNFPSQFDFENDLYMIAEYLILDKTNDVIQVIDQCLNMNRISVHFLRFVTELLLFFYSIGRIDNDDIQIVDNVLEKYVTSIMCPKNSETVAFYVSKMQTSKQIKTFAKYLEKFENKTEQIEAIKSAEMFGLNVKEITKTAVETIRNHANSETGKISYMEINEDDRRLVHSISLLLLYESQKFDALQQCNLSMNYFLRTGKCKAADLLMNSVPEDLIVDVKSLNSSSDTDTNIDDLIHEFLSYKAYLDAKSSFSKWFDFLTKCKPVKPADLSESSLNNFTEKVAHEHKLNQYANDLVKWKSQLENLTKISETYLFNVLLFPNGGWLSNVRNCDVLRSKYIPEVVFLIYKMISENEQFHKVSGLTDLVVSSKYELYKCFSRQELKDFLKKLTQCSLKIV